MVKTVNASIVNGSNKIEICINSKAPHGFETSIVLRNYSDLASENADLKGLQYLAVSYPYFSNRDIYKEPMNYVEINDIRIFEIDEKIRKSAARKGRLKVYTTQNDLKLYLALCDKTMSLGLFKNDESFDQNRILISSSKESLKWANDLFTNVKEKM